MRTTTPMGVSSLTASMLICIDTLYIYMNLNALLLRHMALIFLYIQYENQP
jgi:hypothetical protein